MADYRIEYLQNGKLVEITRLFSGPVDCLLYCAEFDVHFVSCQRMN